MKWINVIAFSLATALLVTWTAAPAEAGQGEDEEYRIHVVTMGPGDDVFARFGHIALMVENRHKHTRKVYNFGTFSFDDPDIAIKYARGYLVYWLSASSWKGIVRKYQYFNREVAVQTLALTPEQAEEVARRLEINLLPENREYDYRHYLDNCCTRIRDLLDDVLDGAISKGVAGGPTGRTYRDWTDEALTGLPLYKTAILFSLGPTVDKPITRWDEEFLPSVFFEDLEKIRVGDDDHPLVTETRTVVKRTGADVGVETPSFDIAVIAVVLALLTLGLALPALLGNKKTARRLTGLGLLVWGLLGGLGGLLLAVFWVFTEHLDTHFNENNLATPFLHLWLIGPGLMLIFKARLKARTQKILKWYLLVALALIVLDALLKIGPFIQNNWNILLFAAAVNLLALAALRRGGVLRPNAPSDDAPPTPASRR